MTEVEWSTEIDRFLEEENKKTGREIPVYRIFCQDSTDRSGGGLYNETVTVDTIGRFARALGDSNPLYSDPAYAAAGPWEGIVAPPLLECCVCSTFIGGKMPRVRGLQVYDAGTKWERFLPIRPGDVFTAVTRYLGVEELTKPEPGDISALQIPAAFSSTREPAEPGEPGAFSSTRESAEPEEPGAFSSTREPAEPGEPGAREEPAEKGARTSPRVRTRLLLRSHEIILRNQRGEHVSTLTARTLLRCPPQAEAGGTPAGKGDPVKAGSASGRPRYTDEQLQAVYANLDAQLAGAFRRGGQTRRWEDVRTGETLPEQIVGPYDESDGFSLMAAIGAANAFATKRSAARRGRGLIDPETGARRLPIDRHFSDSAAQAQGLPRAIVSGIHSQALLAKSVSDWMGDEGFLRTLDCRCRRPLYYGDLSTQRGQVAAKYEENGKHCVVLKMEAVRQDGVVHTEAEAVVELN